MVKPALTSSEKGRRGKGEKGKRGEGEKGRRGEGEKGACPGFVIAS